MQTMGPTRATRMIAILTSLVTTGIARMIAMMSLMTTMRKMMPKSVKMGNTGMLGIWTS